MPKARSTTSTHPTPDLPTTYEAALGELEQLIGRLDAGQLPLDELLVQYQRGALLLAFCRDKLHSVEDQIKVLEDGELVSWVGT